MIGAILGHITGFFENLFTVLLSSLSDMFSYLFQKLFDLLKLLFTPIFILIAMLFYFIQQLATVIFLLLKVILGIGKVFYSLIEGIIATLAGFHFTASTPDNGDWTSIFNNVATGFNYFQIDNVAYVLMFLVWFGTAFAAIRIISTMGSGGNQD